MSNRRHHVITTPAIDLLDEHHAAHTTFCGGTAQKNKFGGSSSAVSHADIIDDARLKRLERLELKQRHDSATKLQEWWRGVIQMKQIRKELRFRFEADVLGIDGIRCLVLLNKDEEALGIWSRAVLAAGSGE
jgi:ubiquitin-protein ligase E3 C